MAKLRVQTKLRPQMRGIVLKFAVSSKHGMLKDDPKATRPILREATSNAHCFTWKRVCTWLMLGSCLAHAWLAAYLRYQSHASNRTKASTTLQDSVSTHFEQLLLSTCRCVTLVTMVRVQKQKHCEYRDKLQCYC